MLALHKHRKETMLMKLFLVSLVAACALLAAMATSAVASTDSHFPEINPPGGATACAAIAGSGAIGSGSDTGLANKGALLTDACLGGP
jgi:hypothetical protein